MRESKILNSYKDGSNLSDSLKWPQHKIPYVLSLDIMGTQHNCAYLLYTVYINSH